MRSSTKRRRSTGTSGKGIYVELPVTEIVVPVLFGYLPNDTAGIACSDNIRRDVLSDDTSGTDDRIIPDNNSGQDGYASADPYIVADCNVDSILVTGVACLGMDGMPCRIY